MTTMRPMGNRVMIKCNKAQERSPGGIILPDTIQKDRPTTGLVTAVGPGRYLENGTLLPPLLKDGDEVMFSKHSGSSMDIDGEEFLIIDADEIMAVNTSAS